MSQPNVFHVRPEAHLEFQGQDRRRLHGAGFARNPLVNAGTQKHRGQKNERQKNADHDLRAFSDSFFCHQFFCRMCSCVNNSVVFMSRLRRWVAGEVRAKIHFSVIHIFVKSAPRTVEYRLKIFTAQQEING